MCSKPLFAVGAGRQEEREDSAPLEDGACAHPLQPLPTGMTREGRIKETPEGRYKVMVQLRLDCAFDYASRVLRGYSELRNFLDTHAMCMCAPVLPVHATSTDAADFPRCIECL